MNAHTHTDWQVDGSTVYALNLEGSNRFTANVQPGWATDGRLRTESEECVANARLMAAAPCLLAALRDAEEFIANGIEYGYIRMPDADTPDSAHETPEIIRAAIAKATGAPP